MLAERQQNAILEQVCAGHGFGWPAHQGKLFHSTARNLVCILAKRTQRQNLEIADRIRAIVPSLGEQMVVAANHLISRSQLPHQLGAFACTLCPYAYPRIQPPHQFGALARRLRRGASPDSVSEGKQRRLV